MLSIWERNSFIHYDHIIIGGGIVGLSTAYYLKKKYPNQSVQILERGLLPSGASTRNAGFACMGSPTELVDNLKSMREEAVLEIFVKRKKGLERLRSMLGDEAMGYATNGSYELILDSDKEVLDQLDYLNVLLQKELNTNAFSFANEKIEQFQFDKSRVLALIQNRCEGEIDTGKTMQALIQLVIKSGIEIKTGCEVMSFEDGASSVELICKNPISNEPWIFKSSNLFICNNAFATTLLPDYNVVPGRGQVLITKPIPNLPFKGIFHFQQGYYYFREYQGCVLFGGGRNIDFQKETTTSMELNDEIQAELIHYLRTLILPNHTFEIDLKWAGIMAFGADKHTIVKRHSAHVFVGVRMGGMGVAIGSEVGFQLAEMIG